MTSESAIERPAIPFIAHFEFITPCDECGARWTGLWFSAGKKVCVDCAKGCKKPCGCSTGIHEADNSDGTAWRPWGLTFGTGKLDEFGYWEKPCGPCARQAEIRDKVPFNSYWPYTREGDESKDE